MAFFTRASIPVVNPPSQRGVAIDDFPVAAYYEILVDDAPGVQIPSVGRTRNCQSRRPAARDSQPLLTGMTDNLFYHLGRKMGPKLRKARWMWESFTGTEADAIRLERAVGLDLATEAGRQIPLDTDVRTTQVLDRIGNRLSACVANPLRSFHFRGFHVDEPNAFALPGGYIFVSRSILELCRWDEGEIAFLLGHEMAHVVRGHAIERIVTNSAISLASRAAPVQGVLAGWLRSVGVKFLETAYSRDQESQADLLGLRLALAAGYDPQSSLRLFSRLAELKKSSPSLSLGEYFSSHPACETRVQDLRHYLRRIRASG
jgi:predicted Zn-dependent protease